MEQLLGSSITYRIAVGLQQGRKVFGSVKTFSLFFWDWLRSFVMLPSR